MSFRKGSSPHRAAGNVFFISMLSLSASGAYLALMKHQMNNVFGGVLTFYMVATAWVTVRRKDKDGQTGIFDWGACTSGCIGGRNRYRNLWVRKGV